MRSRDRSWSVCKPSWSMWSDRCSVSRSGSRGSVGSSPNEPYAYAPAEWLRLPTVPLFEDTFSQFLIPSNSSYSFRSAAYPHLVVCFSSNRPSLLSFTFLSCVTWRSYPFKMCSQNMQFFFFFCQMLALAGGSLFKCWQSERFSKEHDQMKEGESRQWGILTRPSSQLRPKIRCVYLVSDLV